ncbi:hypothetical protein ACH5RR_008118 [Cinchona calisaya]|uniref:Uncharacterized protein n=1 Tax=Cinchona calisaya TaxID=153742 RepID=A0ABD3AAG1_9GENT
MGNKRKALNSTAVVESGVAHHQSNEAKIVLNKNQFVSVEAQFFHDKLASIASPCLERGIDFYGPGDDKTNNLIAAGEVRRAFLSKISDRTWYKFVREDAIVGHDTLVQEFIANTHKLTGIIVQIRKRSKHDKSLQDLIAKHQYRAQAEHVVALDSHSHGQQSTWEPPPPTHPDYVFHRSRTGAELRSLAVYHSRSLHALHHKLDILAHQLLHVQPLNMASWSLEPDAPSWQFGPPDDDDFGPGSEESEEEYADHEKDDGVGPSGHS